MKKILFLLAFSLFTYADIYTGFMHPKPGSWAKYVMQSDYGPIISITKYLGTTKYKGKKVNIIENEMKIGNMEMVSQQWSTYENDSVIQKVITLTSQGIMCMSSEMYMSGPQQKNPGYLKTPKKYSPKKSDIRYATYTLPNGKKVRVAIFKEGDSEVWVSSEVPFGIVKVVTKGKTVLKLVNYGLSGAKAKIPLNEAKACKPMALPFPAM